MSYMFYSCPSLKQLDMSNWKTGLVTTMRSLYCNCNALTTMGNINNWDTHSLYDGGWMFDDCHQITSLNLSNWDTSSLKGTYTMFSNTPKLQTLNLSNWNLSKASQGSAPNADDDYMQNMFADSAVNNIIMENSYADSINKIINKLVTKTADNPGTLDISGVDDLALVNAELAQSKFWNISN